MFNLYVPSEVLATFPGLPRLLIAASDFKILKPQLKAWGDLGTRLVKYYFLKTITSIVTVQIDAIV